MDDPGTILSTGDPMFTLRAPTAAMLDELLAEQREEPLSYLSEGMTGPYPATGFPRLHHTTQIGEGLVCYRRAVDGLRVWPMYDLPWIRLHPARPAIEPGNVFAAIVSHLGFFSVNPCRIVYVESEDTATLRRFAFGIGTLPAHSERGEERFSITFQRDTGAVTFEILALAGAQHWMARLGTPYVRRLQRRFAREAMARVRAAASGR